MPYDPTLPADHAPVVAAELRNQFNALNDLITAQQAQLTDLQNQITALSAQLANKATAIPNLITVDSTTIPMNTPMIPTDVYPLYYLFNQLILGLQQP